MSDQMIKVDDQLINLDHMVTVDLRHQSDGSDGMCIRLAESVSDGVSHVDVAEDKAGLLRSFLSGNARDFDV